MLCSCLNTSHQWAQQLIEKVFCQFSGPYKAELGTLKLRHEVTSIYSHSWIHRSCNMMIVSLYLPTKVWGFTLNGFHTCMLSKVSKSSFQFQAVEFRIVQMYKSLQEFHCGKKGNHVGITGSVTIYLSPAWS